MAVLEREWREAEELAAKSGRLLVPESIRTRLQALRKIAGRTE